jgi:hypothetical protein
MNERKEMKPQNERGVQTRSETDLSLLPRWTSTRTSGGSP